MNDPPAHRRPILDLAPHITLDDSGNVPTITLDTQGTKRIILLQHETETAAEPDDLPHRRVNVAQFADVRTVQAATSTAILADDGWMPRMLPRTWWTVLPRQHPIYDDFAGVTDGTPLFGIKGLPDT